MDVLKRLKRLTCRHEFGWAERRHAEVCYRCGQVRDAGDRPPADPPAPPKSGD